jgi:hypothetical protein
MNLGRLGTDLWQSTTRTAPMHDRYDELKPGTRVRLTELGKERSPRLKDYVGKVVGISLHTSTVRVLFEGRKAPVTLHVTYIEPM